MKGTIMEGRRIRGDGLDHEQDYVRERIEQVGGTDDYAEASEVLEEELEDIDAARGGARQGSQEDDPSLAQLRQTAGMPVERGELRQGDALDVTTNSVVDVQQLPPEAEARSRTKSQLEGGPGGTGLGR
jgi:hypothetical protein